jgi:tetratricopeptide (TPR) repeat protein
VAAAWALCETLDLNSKAGRELCHMLDIHADQPTGRMQLGQFAMRRNDPAAAIRQMRRLDPENGDYQFNPALAWNELGSTQESLAALKKTVKLDPGHARAWYNLGLARSGMDQPAEAIAALRRGESADPNDASIPYARATIHARLGENQDALAAAARALQLRPDFPEARQLIGTLSR